jgi:hypothetical protein
MEDWFRRKGYLPKDSGLTVNEFYEKGSQGKSSP